MGHLGGAGLHLIDLGAGAGEGHCLLGELGAIEDIAVRNGQVVGGHGDGHRFLLHHVKHHVHAVVAALNGNGHAIEQGVRPHLQVQGLSPLSRTPDQSG